MTEVRVSAPSARAALALQRAVGGCVVGLRCRWTVELDVDDEDELVDEVAQWLRDEHAQATVVFFDAVPRAIGVG